MTDDYRERCADAAMNAWSMHAVVCDHSQTIPIGNLVDAVLAVRDQDQETLRSENEELRKRAEAAEQEAARLQGVIDRHDYGIMPVCEGYMASRAEHAERELKAERERAEAAEAANARTRERLDALIEAGFGAVGRTLRELRASLDSQETDRG